MSTTKPPEKALPKDLMVPPEALDQRRGSKVTFGGGTKEQSNDDDNQDTLSSVTGRMYARNIRRGSATPSQKSENGSISMYKPRKRLSSKFESLDYNVVESQRFLQEQTRVKPKSVQKTALTRWFVNFCVGAYVALIAVLVALLITYISKAKFMAIYHLIKDCEDVGCLVVPTLAWMGMNVFLVTIGSYLVTYHAPHAAGSGIPQIKCYLNGIKLPGLLSLKTLVAKAGGVVLSVGGGLACGKEGPMIHSGAICASGMSRAEFHFCGKKCAPTCCAGIRSDEERRDFVVAGAASGVSAAFASPVGGVLFALEEGASFLKQMLTWRMLFSSMTASLLLNILMSAIKGHSSDMSDPGLISFGYLGDIKYRTFEIPIFMLMACVGGLSGALFNQLNYHLTLFRRRVINKRNWTKVAEAAFVAAMSAVIIVVLIYAVPDCKPIKGFHLNENHNNVSHHDNISLVTAVPEHHDLHRRSSGGGGHHEAPADHHGNSVHSNQSDHDGGQHDPYGDHGHGYVFKGFCPYGQKNGMADILFKTPEGGLHAMLHGEVDEWNFVPLIVLCIVYHLLATWTYGLMVSSGVFIPSLLIGALWGRIIGMVVMKFVPEVGVNIAKYCLIGAACQLGGTVRMTISLTVIVIECTGDITFGIPIILSLIIAKWMGDFFNPGIYDLHIEIMGIPLLPWEPPELCFNVQAKDCMSAPVVCLRSMEKIGRIAKILHDDETSHNGFPVVEDYEPDTLDSQVKGSFGRIKGFILRSQLQDILLKEGEEIAEEEMDATIDLRMHMDRSPYTIQEDVSLPRIFKLFRGIGLRHLVVVNDRNRVVGMITRINLARYREESVRGKYKLEELEIMDQ